MFACITDPTNGKQLYVNGNHILTIEEDTLNGEFNYSVLTMTYGVKIAKERAVEIVEELNMEEL